MSSREKRYKKVKASKKLAFEEQKGLCYLCNKPMNNIHLDPLQATWDHLTPRAKGGTNERSNLALAHQICNERKRALSIEQARASKVWELEPLQWQLLKKQVHATNTGYLGIMLNMHKTCNVCGINNGKQA